MTVFALMVCTPLLRVGLREVMKARQPKLKAVEAEGLEDALVQGKTLAPMGILILDMDLPDCNSFMGLVRLRTEFPTTPIVVMSKRADPASIERAMAFGAAGYIPKASSCEDISTALDRVVAGGSWLPSSNPDAGDSDLAHALSPAQLRILVGLRRGLRNKQIAFEMGVTENTVKTYISTMYRRLGVNSRTQALFLLRDVLPAA